MLYGTGDFDKIARFAPLLRHGNLLASGEECSGIALGLSGHFIGRTLVNHPSAKSTGIGPYVDNMIGGAHHLFIVFHND